MDARASIRRTVPGPVRAAARDAYWWFRRQEELAPQRLAAARLLSRYGPTVGPPGPFEGMRYLDTLDDGCLVPKLVGSYEEELHGALRDLISRDYRRVIDVGCASGFYVSGFARLFPGALVWGFDIDAGAVSRARAVAALNEVASRVTLEVRALDPSGLGDLVEAGSTLVFVDIDGPEIALLDPGADPRLLDADIVVELHDYLDPAITPTITHRFAGSHELRLIEDTERVPDPRRYPRLAAVPTGWARRAALAERRPARQSWAVLTRAMVPAARRPGTGPEGRAGA